MPYASLAPRPSWASTLSTIAAVSLLTACGGQDGTPSAADAVVYENARLVTGTGAPPIEAGTFVVSEGRFTAVGVAAEVDAPEGATRVDLGGRTVIPALVNAHVHLSADPDERAEQLRHMAYYGAGTVVSLGLDEGEAPFAMRPTPVEDGARVLTAGRGITAPEPGRSEVPYWVTSEAEARSAVAELAERDVDIVKIWVDDRNGQYEKLPADLYSAVIDEAHRNLLRVTAHVYTLDDAKALLRAGIDAFAHGVRDRDVDDELVDLWTARPNVVLVPNLPDPGVAQDLSWIETVPAEQLAEMQERSTDRPQAQEAFGIQARNLARLEEAGIPIAFGTDGSTAWAVHQELEDMVRSGMTPAEVLVAATRNAAELMGLGDVGTLAVGSSADFVVLGADPLADIANTRMIEAVYLRGSMVDRDALAARLTGGM